MVIQEYAFAVLLWGIYRQFLRCLYSPEAANNFVEQNVILRDFALLPSARKGFTTDRRRRPRLQSLDVESALGFHVHSPEAAKYGLDWDEYTCVTLSMEVN
jgi:hypothetical protein